MFGKFFRKLLGSESTPEQSSNFASSNVFYPHPDSLNTGIPNPDGATSGFRPDDTPFIAHPFQIPVQDSDFFRPEITPFLTKPSNDQSPEALAHAEQWFSLWEQILNPHVDAVFYADIGDQIHAHQQFEAWTKHIETTCPKLSHSSDFLGGRTLSLGNIQLYEVLDQYRQGIEAYVHQNLDIDQRRERAIDLAHIAIRFYCLRNLLFGTFLQTPTETHQPTLPVSKALEASVAPDAPAHVETSAEQPKTDTTPESAPDAAPKPIEAPKPTETPEPIEVVEPSPEISQPPVQPKERKTQKTKRIPATPYELSPVEGVTLHDYVAASGKIHSGAPVSDILTVLGISRKQWDEAAMEWQQRIEVFPETVGKNYNSFISQPHPLFPAEPSPDNSKRLISDRDFYIEVAAAVNAATEVGIDAGDFIEECYGVSLSEATAAGVTWMSDVSQVHEIITRVQARQAELVSEMPGVADDIEF
ncbi:DUF6620 family protein [Corynebacterium freiburgense]|uniref:DUF6620 family protein n=1 Tax=Corynebacterium freiburgense TaxID=556548 RepID=UPI00042680EA|nr:DUF6620 family protein [Corynebacterium freiburgense]WJZ01803.1 hypothetical protein CFREI_02495 [Corynebacterium freiburgense]